MSCVLSAGRHFRAPASAVSLIGVIDDRDLIRLEAISKSFAGPQGRVHAVRGLDVSIARGETVALLGPNGAGKSTTIDVLLGLSRPDSGSVSIFGATPAQAIASGAVGATLQTGQLIRDLSVRELVVMLGSLYPRAMDSERLLELTGLQGVAQRRTQKLSGGETQRVRFALALVADPELLVLDEPTVAMDVGARREFWATVRALAAEGRTVLFATHYLEEADSYADRVVLMAAGRVVADGATTEIKAMVGTRTIRATLPGVAEGELLRLRGVISVERHGEAVTLRCSDSDAALRQLLAAHAQARDIEVRGGALEDAFIALTDENSASSAALEDRAGAVA
jgi:ABC-2 type transport system ATP-binding protein